MAKDYTIAEDAYRTRTGYIRSSSFSPAEDLHTIFLNRIAWGPVFAGVFVALAVQLVLNLIGVSAGAASMDSVQAATINTQATVTSFPWLAAVWCIVVGILASFAGGFTAGRLAGEPKESTAGWHGLTTWAVCTLVIAVLMTSVAGTLLGGAFQFVTYSGGVQINPVTATGGATITTVDSSIIATATLCAAIALILSAGAAWFGGCAGTIEPTVRETRLDTPLH